MNKTVNINLAGIFFHIDEDAYLKLQRYLEAIKRSFTDSQGRSEIISDIEARVAELFSERIQNEKQVVGTKLVDEVIAIMGQPEDYLVDDEIFEDEPKAKQQRRSSSSNSSSKKLYRDTDSSYIGGVASGLSHYLGIDIVWVRLLWVLFAVFSGGTFIVIYLIFWALIPEATTTAEKLTMSGDPVNISNIEKKIKDGIDTVSEKVKNVDLKKHGEKLKEGFENVSDNISDSVKSVDFQKQGNRIKSSSRNFFGTFGDIIMFFLKVFAKFIAIILIITGISALIGLIVALFTIGVTDAVHFPGMDFFELANTANIPIWLMSLLLFFAVGIPFFFIFYIGLRILVNNLKSIGNVAKFSLLGLWLLSIIGLVIMGVKQATEYTNNATVKVEAPLNIKTTDTLKLKMYGNTNYDNSFYRNSTRYRIYRNDNDERMIGNSDIRLIVKSTKDSTASIEILKNAYGSRFEIAKERAGNINYNYALVNNELRLDSYLTTAAENKFSEQEVQVVLYLPEGTILYADDNTYRYHRNSSYYNDILKNGMEEKYLEIIEDGINCDECEKENDDSTSLNINSDEGVVLKWGDSEWKMGSDTIKVNASDVQVRIDEEKGIEIKSNNNDN
jgi:phage shock protein PspC (stress-responsive transcriptional regulator)